LKIKFARDVDDRS